MSGSNGIARVTLVVACLLGPVLLIARAGLDDDGGLPVVTRGGPRVGGAVLVSVDGLPGETLRFYGERPAPPALDALAQLAIEVWLHHGAVTSEPAAATSLVTGRLPSGHGVTDWDHRLDPSVPTLAAPFARAGLPTAAVTNLPLLSLTGLGVDFAHTDERPGADAAQLADAARAWLAQRADADGFLLWVHVHPGLDGDGSRAVQALELVTAGVTAGLRDARQFESSTVAVTGTFGRRGAGRGGDARTPWLVKLPARASAASVRVGPTSSLDVAPTLAGFMRLEHDLGGVGRALLSGRPMPLRQGRDLPAPVAMEWLEPDRQVLVLRDLEAALSDEPGRYDLRRDPRARVNRVDDLDVGAALDEPWQALQASRPAPVAPLDAAWDDASRRALRELGYAVAQP